MTFIKEEEKYIIREGYEITFKTTDNHELNKIDNTDKEIFIKLMDITKNDPKSAINDLLNFKKKYPNLYIVYNYLYNAYTMIDQKEEAYKIAEESYKKFPDNIYAKITYAYKFLNNNDFETVSKIFDNKFDLKEIYPDKKSFHISEFASLTDFCVSYFLKINQIDKAKEYFYGLKNIAPSHRLIIVITRRLSSFKS